jgi:hypothetical protein
MVRGWTFFHPPSYWRHNYWVDDTTLGDSRPGGIGVHHKYFEDDNDTPRRRTWWASPSYIGFPLPSKLAISPIKPSTTTLDEAYESEAYKSEAYESTKDANKDTVKKDNNDIRSTTTNKDVTNETINKDVTTKNNNKDANLLPPNFSPEKTMVVTKPPIVLVPAESPTTIPVYSIVLLVLLSISVLTGVISLAVYISRTRMPKKVKK